MLVELFNQNFLDQKKLLLKNYKKLALNEYQLTIVLLVMDLSSEQTKHFITSQELARYMSISADEIDLEIDQMIQQNFVEITAKGFDFKNLFLELTFRLENEYLDHDNQSFLDQLCYEVNEKLSLDDLNYLKTKMLSNFSQDVVLHLAKKPEVRSFSDLKVQISGELDKKPRAISRYNWLKD